MAEKVTQFLKPIVNDPRYLSLKDKASRWAPDAGKFLVGLYFLNSAYSALMLYFVSYGRPFTSIIPSFFILPATLGLILPRRFDIPGTTWKTPSPVTYGLILGAFAGWDATAIAYAQVHAWLFEGKSLYINELMVKKAAIVGALLMVLVNDPYFKEKIDHTSKALQGLLLKEQPKYRISQRTSVVLLIVRVLISSLFVFVGYGEIKRQIAVSQMAGVQHHGHRHGRPEGDGHDQMWLKVAQFALSMPFVVGWKTSLFARLLAIAMVAEALIYWQFWNTQLGMWYGIHARDHFTVNVGVAGGLLLLQEFGGGKFSVDEMLKKNQ